MAFSGQMPMGKSEDVTEPEEEIVVNISPSEETEEEIEDESDEGEEEILEEAMKTAITDKRGGDPDDLEITVDEIDGDYASGGAVTVGAVAGGGMWFAAKVDGQWELVWDGNGTIMCSDLEDYPNFPSRMIPECYNEDTEEVVAR